MTSVMKEACESGFWPIYNYNPTTKEIKILSDFNDEKYYEFLNKERRFKSGDSALIERQINDSKEFISYLKDKQKNGK